jgi:hypothetical protein
VKKNRIYVLSVFLGIGMVASLSQAALISRHNQDLRCTEYQVLHNEYDKEGNLVVPHIENAIKEGAVLVNNYNLWGLTLENMKVDFEGRFVTMNVVQKVVLGFNRVLMSVRLYDDNPKFEEYLNKVNYDFLIARKMCIQNGVELISME